MQKKSYQDWIDGAQALLTAVYAADVALLLYLLDFEASKAWEGAVTSFAQLLEDQGLPKPGRYEAFKAALTVITVEQASKIGVEATIAASKITTPERRNRCIETAEAWVDEKGHPPSAETAQKFASQVDPKEVTPGPLVRKLKSTQLEEENRVLRAKVRELEREVTVLRERLTAVDKKPKGKGGAPATV